MYVQDRIFRRLCVRKSREEVLIRGKFLIVGWMDLRVWFLNNSPGSADVCLRKIMERRKMRKVFRMNKSR